MTALPTDSDLITIRSRVTDPPLDLLVNGKSFRPNPTTVRFSRVVKIEQGDLVFDIGTGVGPLAIMAAKRGAAAVVGVDPVPLHCELARRNVARYDLEQTITIRCGEFFDPIDAEPALMPRRPDVIIGDVSGIADTVAHALGWYSEIVPTGGDDGTEIITAFLRRAPEYLAPEGSVYFPIANDLSDGEKVLDVARSVFEDVTNAMDVEYVRFPMSEDEVLAISNAYDGSVPSFITIQREGSRSFWRGQILRARSPR